VLVTAALRELAPVTPTVGDVVIDPQVVVATMTHKGGSGDWFVGVLSGQPLAAAHLMPAQVAAVAQVSRSP
jgi:hypothetical protein